MPVLVIEAEVAIEDTSAGPAQQVIRLYRGEAGPTTYYIRFRAIGLIRFDYAGCFQGRHVYESSEVLDETKLPTGYVVTQLTTQYRLMVFRARQLFSQKGCSGPVISFEEADRFEDRKRAE